MTDDAVSNEVMADKRAPVSAREKKRLLKELRKAAKLLESGELSNLQYAALVVYNTSRLGGEIAPGESLGGTRISGLVFMPERAIELLVDEAGGLEATLTEFGPWNQAPSWLYIEFGGGHHTGEFVWKQEVQERLEEARLRLQWWPRIRFRWEAHLERNRKYFPRTTELLQKAFIAFGAAVVGGVVGAVLTGIVAGGGAG